MISRERPLCHPQRFVCAIPDVELEDLQRRLALSRWPDEFEGGDWSYGIPPDVMRDLVYFWQHNYDWRATERRLNNFDQFTLTIAGLRTHFIHQRSRHPDATPLLLVHGWPGSVLEFLDAIERLCDPEKFGGAATDAFHVVCPSLPGYGFSDAPRFPGTGPLQIATQHLELMHTLGYERFIAQGGDWGAIINRYLPDIAPERLIGLHFNLMTCRKPKDVSDPMALLTQLELERFKRDQSVLPQLVGYQAIQSTKPQTLAYGLMDSPVGCAAWIAEKFHDWTDHDGDMRDALSFDQIVGNIALYWLTGTIASSVRLYRELGQSQQRGERPGRRVDVPTGVAHYPGEVWVAPRAWMEHEYNLIHWYDAPRGGHFAAFEQPDVFASDLWKFGSLLRQGR